MNAAEGRPVSQQEAQRTVVLLVARAHDWPSLALIRANDFALQLGAELWILELRVKHFHGTAPLGSELEEVTAWCGRVLRKPFPQNQVLLRDGGLDEAVLSAAKECSASFVVLPPEFQGAATRLATKSGLPILAARLGSTGRTVMAATDLSDEDLPVVHYGARLSARLGEDLVVLHNVGPMVAPIPPGFYPVVTGVEPPETLVASRRELLEKATHDLPALHTVVDVETKDTAADAVLDAARSFQSDLIVVGTHPHTWLGRVMLHSTAQEVVDRSMRSVLVVPLPKHHGAPLAA